MDQVYPPGPEVQIKGEQGALQVETALGPAGCRPECGAEDAAQLIRPALHHSLQGQLPGGIRSRQHARHFRQVERIQLQAQVELHFPGPQHRAVNPQARTRSAQGQVVQHQAILLQHGHPPRLGDHHGRLEECGAQVMELHNVPTGAGARPDDQVDVPNLFDPISGPQPQLSCFHGRVSDV